MKSFIDFAVEQRQKSKNEFDKAFEKAVMNINYGKSVQDVRKYSNVRLISDLKKFCKVCAKPQFKRGVIINEDLVATSLHKTSIIKRKYPACSSLLFTDTDSLTYIIETEDIYKDMNEHENLFDFSSYPQGHLCYDISNKKVLGKFKGECNSIPLRSFVGLRAKMYSLSGAKIEKKIAKGVKRDITKKCTET